jgi:hypothetical protein
MACLAQAVKAESLPSAENFLSPPPEFRPMIWWHWVNGNVTREGIDKDLRAMKDAGIGGFHLFDVSMTAPGPIRYGSPEWMADRDFALGSRRAVGDSGRIDEIPGVDRNRRRRR